MSKILVVEDDSELGGAIEEWLCKEGHAVDRIGDGLEAVDRLKFYQYDVVVLDLNLPGLDGLDVCKQYRANGGSASVLMLTGRREIEDKELGLDSGADDYLTKPFNARELSARVRALLRRPRQTLAPVITLGELELNPASRRVTRAGKDVNLVPQEYAILEFLMRHPNQAFSSETIIERVWSSESESSPDVVRVHIARLRSKLEGGPPSIKTVHRIGYMLEFQI